MDTSMLFGGSYRMSILNNREKFYIRLPPATIISFPLTSTFYRIQCLRFMESRFNPSSTSYQILNEIRKSNNDPAQLSIASTISIATKLIKQRYEEYGFAGLYQGFGSMAIHTVIRDLIVFILSKFPSFNVSIITDSISPASTDNDTLKNGLRWIRRNKKQLNELLLTLFSEIISYPLLLCTTRLIIYDGTQSISLWEMLQMTYYYEGFWALYKGVIPHLYCIITSQIRNPQPQSLALSNNTDITADMLNLIISISNSHIMQISTSQRCFSPIKGLCTHTDVIDLIKSIGWKNIAIQLCLGSFLITTKCYTANMAF